MTLIELIESVKRRPGMWLPDDRWTTALAFVLGLGGVGGTALDGLQEWAAEQLVQQDSSLAWFSLLYRRYAGDPQAWPRPYDLPDEMNASIRDAMLDLVLAFLRRGLTA